MTAPLHSFLAAGLFDSPWAIAVVVIVGALINWLTKRREQKQANRRAAGNEPPPPSKPDVEFNLEETLRRLMGEEVPLPMPPPPPLPRAARDSATPMRLPPILVAPPVAKPTTTTASEQQARADRRFEQLNEQGRHPATVISHGRDSRSHSGKRANSPWRNPRSARQAFVASLIFAPPKGLES